MAEAQEQQACVPRSFTLLNGQVMPSVGLGTFQLKEEDKHVQLIHDAIVQYGYRLIDTAMIYRNEELVG